MSRSSRRRLADILTAIAAIEGAEAVGRRHAEDDELPEVVLAAIQFHVFTIGEAVKALPSELTARRSDVPWSDIARMRDLIGHHYDKLDAVIVRATIGEPLERLRAACEAMLAEDLA
ncbi:HepT-like ribonuclease domain-containing protein [Cellulomonas citrea]|uniref:HepT-like ribonuclease domain-containing protein n=1 Tax=Cellulomonas citrea TaxID=1909423 RepID=UPI00135A5E4D|nr:HepT-like ribonuclease domain-containing protein [Cellulomonas citrea]